MGEQQQRELLSPEGSLPAPGCRLRLTIDSSQAGHYAETIRIDLSLFVTAERPTRERLRCKPRLWKLTAQAL